MALHVAAQDKVKLSGRVIDDEQNPVLFAVVKVDGQAAGTTTDLQGRYQLEFSTADTVTVSFSMIGYVTKKKTLVRPKGSLRLNITLQTQSIDMGEVTVKEVRRQMNSTQHLNAENLKRLPSTTGNAVEELVATQAGVSTHNELSSQYNVRGGSFDENSVYINGVEVYRPMLISSGQQEGLSVINSDMVESINFSAGGFDAKYGDKMSSVLDITYKKPKKFEASVSASLLGAGLYVGYAKKNFSMTHGVRYKTNQYMLGSLETKGEYSPRFLDYQTYISWSPNKRWSLDFIGNISQNQYDFLPTNRQTNFGTMQDVKSFRVYFDGKEEDLFRTLFGTLSLSHSFTDRTKLFPFGFGIRHQGTGNIRHPRTILARRDQHDRTIRRRHLHGACPQLLGCQHEEPEGLVLPQTEGARHTDRTHVETRNHRRELTRMGNARLCRIFHPPHGQPSGPDL